MPRYRTASVSKKAMLTKPAHQTGKKTSTKRVAAQAAKRLPSSRSDKVDRQQDKITDTELNILLPLFVMTERPSRAEREKIKDLMLVPSHRTSEKMENWFDNRRKRYHTTAYKKLGRAPILQVASDLNVVDERGMVRADRTRVPRRYLRDEVIVAHAMTSLHVYHHSAEPSTVPESIPGSKDATEKTPRAMVFKAYPPCTTTEPDFPPGRFDVEYPPPWATVDFKKLELWAGSQPEVAGDVGMGDVEYESEEGM